MGRLSLQEDLRWVWRAGSIVIVWVWYASYDKKGGENGVWPWPGLQEGSA